MRDRQLEGRAHWKRWYVGSIPTLFLFAFTNTTKGEKNMNKLLNNAERFVKKNGSTILTCIGGIGVVATSVMAVKATPKALRLLEDAKEVKGEELTKMEKVRVAGPVYIPAALVGVSTIACIFGANILNKRSQASLMSAYALLDNSYKEYKNKVTELYGEEVDTKIRQEIAKDKYTGDEKPSDNDSVLFYDEFSGRYFNNTMENVLKAEYEINKRISEYAGAFLNEFYALAGIPVTDYGDYLGWSAGQMIDAYWTQWLDFSHEKVTLDDGLECVIITFGQEPIPDFDEY